MKSPLFPDIQYRIHINNVITREETLEMLTKQATASCKEEVEWLFNGLLVVITVLISGSILVRVG